MADFNTALAETLEFEGGYANDPRDAGGETYRGIARKIWPKWEGWAIVDAAKPLKINQIIDDDNLNDLIAKFYKANFWDKNRCGDITNQEVANKVFDLAVNTGNTKFIQNAINTLGHSPALVADGAIGPRTIAAVNNYKNQKSLLGALRMLQSLWYNSIIANKPEQKSFLANWTRRI